MVKLQGLLKSVIYGAVLGACALGASVALAAWSAPLNAPPTCTSGNPGCDAPLNVSATAQTKSGSLTVSGSGSSITAPQYCIGAACITAWPSGGGGGISGSGTAAYIPMWGSSGTSLTNSPFYESGGSTLVVGYVSVGGVYEGENAYGGLFAESVYGSCIYGDPFTGACACPWWAPYSSLAYAETVADIANPYGDYTSYQCYD